MHDIEDLIRLFNQLFHEQENTVLMAGGDEPLYSPASSPGQPHRIICRLDYFASALHEIAHWCIAGRQRRQMSDYGYWYNPDGRSADQQQDFAQVEARPQALEWILARACRFRFRVSLDNLDGELIDNTPFRRAVVQEALNWQRSGLGTRAAQLHRALADYYGGPANLQCYRFSLEDTV